MITTTHGTRSILLALVVCLATTATHSAPAVQQEPVWMFDHKDTFLDIACLANGKAVIVGDRGRILVTHGRYGNLWAPRDSTTTEMLTAVSFIDDRRGWAAGHGGIIIHTVDGGATWKVQRESTPRNLPLFDIQFLSESVGFASGAYDTLLKTVDGGNTWNSITTGTDNIYNGLFFQDAENGFLLGEFGSLLKTSDGGHSWVQTDVGGYQGSLFDIIFLSRETALAYGINGKLLISRDAGDSWADLSSGTTEALYRASANGDDVVIVGRSGVILVSGDGASSFSRKSQPDHYSLAGVCTLPDGSFIAVGEFGTILTIENSPDE